MKRKTGFSFGCGTVTPPSKDAASLGDLFEEVHWALGELNEAKKRVPSYTGQWNDEDYYADELETYNRALDALHNQIQIIALDVIVKTQFGPQ